MFSSPADWINRHHPLKKTMIEKEIAALTQAVEELTKALLAQAAEEKPVAEEKPKAGKAKGKTPLDPDLNNPPPKRKKATVEDCRKVATYAITVKNEKKALGVLLKEFGAENISSVPEESRGEFLSRLEDIAGKKVSEVPDLD